VPATRVIFLNNYPTEQVIEACRAGDLPRSHLWGVDQLTQAGSVVDIVPFEWSPRLKRLTELTGGRLGDLDHQASVWRLRHGCDLIYAAGPAEVQALAALRLSGALRAPLAACFFHPPAHPGWRALLRGVDLSLCLSSRTGSALRDRFGVPSARVATVGWGPDLGFAEFRSPPPLGDRVVSTGKTRRDHATLLAALREADLPATVLAHGWADDGRRDGSGRSAGPAGADAPPGPLGPRTRLLPVRTGDQVPRRVVATVLAESRVVAVVAADEIGVNGLTEVLEAMALARPLVMTRNRFFDLDVEAIGCGRVVEPGDVAGLAATLTEIWSDPAKATAMGAAGRRHLEESLNYETFGRDLIAALRSVAPV
jgi:hypothetical protein